MKGVPATRGVNLDGAKLRDARRGQGLSQADLADKAGVSEDTVGRAERGRPISYDNAQAIAAYLKIDVADIAAPVEPEPLAPAHRAAAVAMSNIPIRVPTHFMGRDTALTDIEKALARNEGRVAITALHGLRGVGKTVLAAAYAERHAKDYRATWWIRAETESGMRADLVGLGVRLGWVEPEEKEDPALAAVMERLAQDGDGILLIYDNAVEADAIRPYLPRGGAARVLVTSNAHVWRDIAAPIQIGVWPKEVGGEFFVRRTSRAGERDAAVELSELLGGLPLAHEQAAAYCERLEIPLAEYARRFDAEPARLLDADKDAPAEYHDKLTVAKTFALAIEAAAKLHPAAEPLIVYAALLAPEPIPLLLFSEGREHFGEPFASAFAGDGLDEAVAALRAFALVDRESIPDERDPAIMTASIRLHRLVREVAALHFDRDSASIARGHLIAAVAAAYPEQVFHDASAWPRARRLDPVVMKLVTDIGSPSQDLALLISYVLDRLGSFRQRSLADHNICKDII
jgi:DNA-binding XRE family transcriptional regulator